MTRKITILSGKGGAGKTSLSAALVSLLDRVVAVDADVNASNLPLLLPHKKQQQGSYLGMDVALIDQQRCIHCGLCLEECRFGAISREGSNRLVVGEGCEGCGSCAFSCPVGAISMVDHISGYWYQSSLDNGWLVHADLLPGDDNSGKLITHIRKIADQLAEQLDIPFILIDGPPGTSCQAISSISGCDLVVAVVEESLSGLSDYRRLAQLIDKFSTPHLVVINKAGFDTSIAEAIYTEAQKHNAEVAAVIPFDAAIPAALQQMQSMLAVKDYKILLGKLLQRIS